jgi:phytoene dehydrogenase-like protein
MEMKDYDVIIIGGGINSLVSASLLNNQKKSVLLLESKNILGGTAAADEFSPGFKCNMVYDYLRWIDPRVIKELNLLNYGLEFREPNSLRVSLDEKGKHIFFNSDPNKTLESIASHSKDDANKWVDFTKFISKLTQFLEPLYAITPPKISSMGFKDAFTMRKMLNPVMNFGRKGIIDVVRTAPMMMPELLDEWFDSELLRASLSSSGITNLTQGPYSSGTVLNFLHNHIHSSGKIHNAKFVKGGTENFVKILVKIAQEKGVDIKMSSMVKSIKCNNGVCKGVILSNGEEYNSNIIISSLDPTNTFFNLVGNNHISPKFQTQLKNIKYRGSTARVHFSLKKCPKINGLKEDQLDSIFSINPSVEYLERAFDDAKYGRISSNPYVEFCIPTISIPDYAPYGKHVLSATVQYVPYHLRNNNWNNDLKNKMINNVIGVIKKYIPDFSELIENSKIITPLDLEISQGLTEGNLNQGEMTLDQFFFMRPTISTSQYKTPIKNLYLCGSSTHPGGGLHGTNGINSIQNIIN